MPTCKECVDVLYDYIEGTLDAQTTRDLDEHFEMCPPCLEFVRSYRAVPNLTRHALAAEVPSEVAHRLKEVLRKSRPSGKL